jgi:hypothetical protein
LRFEPSDHGGRCGQNPATFQIFFADLSISPPLGRLHQVIAACNEPKTYEVDLTLDRLATFVTLRESITSRRPLGGPDSWVAVMLSYNGSAWLNLVITAAYMAPYSCLIPLA